MAGLFYLSLKYIYNTKMKLLEFNLTEGNHFVAMEYYWLVMNRTFLIILTKEKIIGIQGNSAISVEGGKDILTKQITKSMAVRGDLTNPYSYLKNKYLNQIEYDDLLDGSILNKNKTNFIIDKRDVKNAYYDSSKKFGMGYYPHDGKVYIETYDNKKREFIILGNQSGQEIVNWILTK